MSELSSSPNALAALPTYEAPEERLLAVAALHGHSGVGACLEDRKAVSDRQGGLDGLDQLAPVGERRRHLRVL